MASFDEDASCIDRNTLASGHAKGESYDPEYDNVFWISYRRGKGRRHPLGMAVVSRCGQHEGEPRLSVGFS